MSGLDYGGGSTNIGWKYSKPDSEGYTNPLIGTVLCYQLVQAQDMFSKKPRFFDDGNPIFNARIVLALQDGSLRAFTFTKASSKAWKGEKASVHVELMKIAADRDDLLGQLVDVTDIVRGVPFDNIIGKTVSIQTEPEPGPYPPGTKYGSSTPRPWTVTHVTNAGPFEAKQDIPDIYKTAELLAPNPQPKQQQQPQGYGMAPGFQQPMPQQYQQPYQQQYQQPYQQPMPQQQITPPQPMAQPPMTPVGVTPQMQQPPAMPAGMDPGIAAAMQQLNAQNVQQMNTPYDDSIPF